jgi:hypothetical protein
VKSSAPVRRIGVSAIGVIGTGFVHLLIALPLFLDLSPPAPHRVNRNGAGAGTVVSRQEPTMTVVFINEAEPTSKLMPLKPEDLASRGVAPLDLPISVLSPDPEPAADVSANQSNPDASAAPSDTTQHALLYGRYLGQIQARIERAWMRPRNPIGTRRFSCRARIQQDRRGAVVTIALDHCNGSDYWKDSLLSAIRTASPLPAPPDPSVFADRLWLSFTSDAFDPNGSAEGFEPARGLLAPNKSAPDPLPPEHLSSALAPSKAKDNTNVIHLTIIGNRTYTDSSVPATP